MSQADILVQAVRDAEAAYQPTADALRAAQKAEHDARLVLETAKLALLNYAVGTDPSV